MALTLRGAIGGQQTSTATSVTVTLPTGWAAGDAAVFTAHVGGTSSGTWTAPSGWTVIGQNTSAQPFTIILAKILAGGDSNPVVQWSRTTRWVWAGVGLYSSAGATVSIDTAASLATATAANSVTPGTATPAASGTHASIITLSGQASANGTISSSTYTPSTGWTQPSGASGLYTGAATVAPLCADAAWQNGVSGTVSPGAEQFTDSKSNTYTLGADHILITEAGAPGPLLQSPAYAVQRSVTW